ncbi:putative zinc-type alcohol dehydrogenase-like protein [Rhizomicrobium palustre]|uniref:Putative zinc-type alcohol dehydrogenase-like protein n=1 Tax=Rhizomicrobium palustre TaxID=189966 RepID=A0A846MYD0_9PROT|nr:NAD(P)-dependent alcohol dehydrogenase [Rhizomicrobium palustre]NIK88052.1 putative zinc-type alcohol dehydrogenase-like protein [Rhizomicrobium palustre]
MPISVVGYAAASPTSDLAPYSFERRDPKPDDVVIDILYCGVCHSDLHTARNDWGGTQYPNVPGHEIVGRVIEVGGAVTKFKAGDAVGVGCLVDSCRECEPCQHGQENYCESKVFTYSSIDKDGALTQGGYSTKVVVSERFVLKLPEGMDLKGAAPLLCAGITTYSPLRYWGISRGDRVAVTGLGGLGHMAIKIAKAMGAEVTLFSRSPGKEADARRLGADNVVISTDAAAMAKVKGRFSFILDTVPYDHDLNPYIPTLSVDGTLVLVGYLGPLGSPLNTAPLVLERKAVAGSLIGGLPETQEMLDFCGEHNIAADVEMIAMHEINEAYARMLKSDVKYRFVIDMASLKG